MDASYTLLRSGRLLRTVEDRLGAFDAAVLFQILLLGHTQVSHLATLPDIAKGTTNNLSNGDTHTESPNHLLGALQRLSDLGFIQKVRTYHFQTAADTQEDVEKHVQATMPPSQTKGKRAQEEFDALVNSELRRRKESKFPLSTFHSQHVNGTKRGFDGLGDASHSKRQKLANGASSETNRGGETMDLGPAVWRWKIVLEASILKLTVCRLI